MYVRTHVHATYLLRTYVHSLHTHMHSCSAPATQDLILTHQCSLVCLMHRRYCTCTSTFVCTVCVHTYVYKYTSVQCSAICAPLSSVQHVVRTHICTYIRTNTHTCIYTYMIVFYTQTRHFVLLYFLQYLDLCSSPQVVLS